MTPATTRPLTERQQAVMDRIDRRVPIKVIAQELGVSETRINQHIRALKDIYQVDSLNELVELHREGEDAPHGEGPAPDYNLSAYAKKQVPNAVGAGEGLLRDDPGEIVFNDAMPLLDDPSWRTVREPRVVPGVLDGENAVLFRLAAIVAIAFGILAAVVLTVTASLSLSEAMEGKAHVPARQQASSV